MSKSKVLPGSYGLFAGMHGFKKEDLILTHSLSNSSFLLTSELFTVLVYVPLISVFNFIFIHRIFNSPEAQQSGSGSGRKRRNDNFGEKSVNVVTALSIDNERHIHEFLAMGETPETLDIGKPVRTKSMAELKWIDLVAAKSPALFINHGSEKTGKMNSSFKPSTDLQSSYLVALRDIPPYEEIITEYMEDETEEIKNKTGAEKENKKKL